MISDIANTPEWKREAQRLLDAGYTQINQTEGVIPAIFRKSGQDNLYLFHPTIGGVMRGKYRTVVVEESNPLPADFSDKDLPVLYVPRRLMVPAHQSGYAWLPIRLADKPHLFSVRDAADHLGLSVAMINYATCQANASHPLRSKLRTGRRLLFLESELVTWYSTRPSRGRRATSGAFSPTKLNQMSKGHLVTKVRANLESGNLAFAVLHRRAKDLGINPPPDIHSADEWAQGTSRANLIKVLSEV